MKLKPILIACIAFAAAQCSSPKEQETIQQALSPDNFESAFVEIDPTKDTIVAFPQGTQIQVPANAFIDAAGNVVTKKVKLELKEFYKRSDMLFAGLTTVGENGLLESDGMVYLNGTAEGKEISIAADKPLTMAMPTDSFQADMQFFEGEKQADGNILWKNPQEFLNTSLMEEGNPSHSTSSGEESIEEKEIVAQAPKKPIEYKEEDERILSIEMDDPEKFPELAMYQNVKFRVNEKSEFNRKDANLDWYSMDMTRTVNEGEYFLIFGGKGKKGEKIERKYIVNPVYSGEDYQAALKAYEKKFEAYRKLKLQKQKGSEKQNEYLRRQAEAEKNKVLVAEKQKISQQESLDRTREILERAAANQSRLQAERLAQQDKLLANSSISEASRQARNSLQSINRKFGVLTKEETDLAIASNYIISISGFGWRNCDKYVNNTMLCKIKINVGNTNNGAQINGMVFMNEYKAQYGMAYFNLDKSYFEVHCPKGNKTVLFYSKKDDVYLAFSSSEVGETDFDAGLVIKLKEYTEPEFKEFLVKITQ